ncbi:hypothetical protein E4U61_001911 [Claviceps capensis]|nr:hypothetical protein E4U61_001911 [Claviceps capensis]
MLFRANKANQPSAVDGGHFWNEMGFLIRPLVSPEPPPLSAVCLSLQPSTPRIRAPAHPRSHVIEEVPAQVSVTKYLLDIPAHHHRHGRFFARRLQCAIPRATATIASDPQISIYQRSFGPIAPALTRPFRRRPHSPFLRHNKSRRSE